MKTKSIQLPENVWATLEDKAQKEKKSMAALVRRIIISYLENDKEYIAYLFPDSVKTVLENEAMREETNVNAIIRRIIVQYACEEETEEEKLLLKEIGRLQRDLEIRSNEIRHLKRELEREKRYAASYKEMTQAFINHSNYIKAEGVESKK